MSVQGIKSSAECPTVCAYNGSGFDFNFILRRFLNDRLCEKKFKILSIYKGSNLIFLNVVDPSIGKKGKIILRIHDIC